MATPFIRKTFLSLQEDKITLNQVQDVLTMPLMRKTKTGGSTFL